MLRSRRTARPPQRPGWYPDGAGWLRYYDGHGWTELIRERLVLTDFRARLPEPEHAPRVHAGRSRQGLRVVSVILACLLVGGVVLQLVALTLRPDEATTRLSSSLAAAQARRVCSAHPVDAHALGEDTAAARAAAASRAAGLTQVAAQSASGTIGRLAVAWSNLAVALAGSHLPPVELAARVRAVDTAALDARLSGCQA